MIKQLGKETSQNLCAQQVITSINDCIKQLIDNSIDAGANRIEVYLQEYGKKKITVRDNGCGIGNFESLGLKGSTSKNKGNMNEVQTLGFRGEALHSIAKISQSMILTSTNNKQTRILDLKSSKLQQVNVRRQESGTDVQIQNIFEYLPVRRYELLNKFKQFMKKTDQMIKQYCLIYEDISFVFKNYRDCREDILISTVAHQQDSQHKSRKWLNRIKEILGMKISQNLIYMKTQSIEGWILNNIQSGSSKQNTFIRKNIQYCYLNKRPIDPPSKIISIFDEFHKKYNRSTKYIFILNIILPTDCYDVNLTPNKRQILIKQSLIQKIIAQLKDFIRENVIETVPVLQQFEEKVKQKQRMSEFLKSSSQEEKAKEPRLQQGRSGQKSDRIKYEKLEKTIEAQECNLKMENKIITSKNKPENQAKKNEELKKATNIAQLRQQIKQNRNSEIAEALNRKMSQKNKNESKIINLGITRPRKEDAPNEPKISKQIDEADNNVHRTIHQKSRTSEIVINGQKGEAPLSITEAKEINKGKQQPKELKNQQKSNQVIDMVGNKSEHPPPVLKKQEFENFRVLGQFNHGFIVCSHNDSYYLVDQHAASQKYHFQKLLRIKRNKVQVDDQIQLNLMQLQSLQENRDLLERQGFQFSVLDNAVILHQIPVFLQKNYGKQYFLQIMATSKKLSELQDFYMAAATKACRTAVMVGDVLQSTQMKEIVNELKFLQSPWNCPHGRPTLIYLGQRTSFLEATKCRNREYSLSVE